MRIFIVVILSIFALSVQAQTYIKSERDDVETEYLDGRMWVFKTVGDIVVGVTMYRDNDGYGKNFTFSWDITKKKK